MCVFLRLPVRDVITIRLLDHAEMKKGYASGMRNDPEPNIHRTYSFWHGWRCGRVEGKHVDADNYYKAFQRSYRNIKKLQGW